MTKEELRNQFYKETGLLWKNMDDEPDIDYVEWLENKFALNIARASEFIVVKCDVCGCHPNVIISTKFGTFCQEHARYA